MEKDPSILHELHAHHAPHPLPQLPLAPDLHDRLPRHFCHLVFLSLSLSLPFFFFFFFSAEILSLFESLSLR